MASKHLLVALPASISRDHSIESAFDILVKVATPDSSTIIDKFPIPEFKIGTLDALVQQADDLAKLDSTVEAAVHKAADIISNLVPGKEGPQKLINSQPARNYISSFRWNKPKYSTDRSLSALLSVLSSEASSLDTDIKTTFGSYTTAKTNLAAVQRRTHGNLSTRSLAPLLSRDDVVDSEYLITHLVAVSRLAEKEFLKSYETLSQMVVPRSARKIAQDEEFVLYAVTVFKKFSQAFLNAARAARYTPREFSWSEHSAGDEEAEAERVEAEEKRCFNESLRMTSVGYAEQVQIWAHVKALRVFVESVLRYGLPADFCAVVIGGNEKGIAKARQKLDEKFSYLAGNAVGRDKKGRVLKDENVGSAGAAHLSDDYSPYCCFEFNLV